MRNLLAIILHWIKLHYAEYLVKLYLPIDLIVAWRRDNTSPLLARVMQKNTR
jgi:hypothetical protein